MLTKSLWVLKVKEEERSDFIVVYKYKSGSSKRTFSQLFVE